MTRRIPATLALALALPLLASCSKPGPGDPIVIPLGDERTMPVTEPPMPGPDDRVQSWATAPWSGPWLLYEGTSRLDIQHDLGREPTGVQVWLSFTANGDNPGLAAGDLAQIDAIDANHVIVWNNTSGSYFARVVVF